MKVWRKLLAVAALLVLVVQASAAQAPEQALVWRAFYVATNGNDAGSGTKEDPFLTIDAARRAVRQVSDDMQGDIVVHIAGGYYFQPDTLYFDTEDSGKNGYRVIYRGEEGNMPILSGGRPITGFTPVPGRSDLWQVKVPDVQCIRELYVNEKKGLMASGENKVDALSYWDDPSTEYLYDGLVMSKDAIGIWENQDDIEFWWMRDWKHISARVVEILQDPENADRVNVRMEQPWWNYCGGADFYALVPRLGVPFLIKNAKELLDQPGEHYYEKSTQTLYYMPREGEDLSTATVIVPILEKLMNFDGRNNEQRVSNITFEGLKFAHTTWYAPDESYVSNGQQHSIRVVSGAGMHSDAMVEMTRTDGIQFLGDYFFGTGASGIYLQNAVSNTWINGCAFSDMGESAIVMGEEWHTTDKGRGVAGQLEPPKDSSLQYNLADGMTSKVSASFAGNIAAFFADGDLEKTRQWVEEDDYFFGSTFYSDPEAVKRGEKTWIRFDFQRAYTISQIRLGFAPGAMTDREKSGYEVLLSNDRNFEDYVTVAVQETPAATYQDYFPETEEKYRYLMIRTLEPTDFAISKAWIFTPDRELVRRGVICENNTISNNYITRTGGQLAGGNAISTMYAKGLRILNNEITDASYSGIATGWGWSEWPNGGSDNLVQGNFVSNVTRALNDGGGIYTLGAQPNTLVTENVFEHIQLGNADLYADGGSAEMLWTDNVLLDTQAVYMLFTNGIHDMTIVNCYSDQKNFIDNTTAEAANVTNPITTYLPGIPTPRAYEIIEGAGLPPEYESIREWVYEDEMQMPDFRQNTHDIVHYGYFSHLVTSATERADAILNSGRFGDLPGQYPVKYKRMLQEAKDAMNSSAGDQARYADTLDRLRQLVNEVADSVEHPSLEEMLQICNDALEKAKGAQEQLGGYPLQKISDFEASINAVQEKAKSAQGVGEKYALVLELEDAYIALEEGKYSADILDITAPGLISAQVDDEAKEVLLRFPYNMPLSSVTLTAELKGNAKLGKSLSQLDLTHDQVIPVYCPEKRAYQNWTIRATYEAPQPQESVEGWSNYLSSENYIFPKEDGGVYLAPSLYPAMNASPAGNTVSLSFLPRQEKGETAITVLFGAGSGEEMEIFSSQAKNDRYELIFEKGTVSLQSVTEGTKQLVASGKASLSFERANELQIHMLPAGEKDTRIEVFLDGRKVLSEIAPRKAIEGYYGVYSPNVGVTVYNNG